MAPISRMPRPVSGQMVEVGLKVGEDLRLIEGIFLDLVLDGISSTLQGYLIQMEVPGDPEQGEDPDETVAIATTFFNAAEVVSLTWTDDIKKDVE